MALCAVAVLVALALFLALLFLHVMRDGASGHRANDRMVVSIMSGNTANHRAFQTSGLGRGNKRAREGQGAEGDAKIFHGEKLHSYCALTFT
jgi:hypothetical protein